MKKKLWVVWGALVVVICVAVITVLMIVTLSTLKVQKNFVTEKKTTPVTMVEARAKWLFAGTTFWGRRTNKDARVSELGVKYPFSQLSTLEPAKYEAWVAGLECPVTNNGHNDAEENTIFKFNCDPDYLPEAKKYFTAFLLGNNHTDNQGVEGFAETKKHLDENGIQYFGSYDYQDAQGNCDVLVLPVKVKYSDGQEKTLRLPFGFCSAHGVYGVPTEAVLANMGEYAKVLPTIAMPHMGAEYKATADEIRMNLYHKMIDYGVESVIADHPHWIQNTEAYKGRLIIYSMGNFMFDQTFNKEVARSAAIEGNLQIMEPKKKILEKWAKLGEDCLKDKTTCMGKIKESGLEKLELKWTYDFHGTTSAVNRIPRLASEAEQAEIKQRLDWNRTKADLGF